MKFQPAEITWIDPAETPPNGGIVYLLAHVGKNPGTSVGHRSGGEWRQLGGVEQVIDDVVAYAHLPPPARPVERWWVIVLEEEGDQFMPRVYGPFSSRVDAAKWGHLSKGDSIRSSFSAPDLSALSNPIDPATINTPS